MLVEVSKLLLATVDGPGRRNDSGLEQSDALSHLLGYLHEVMPCGDLLTGAPALLRMVV